MTSKYLRGASTLIGLLALGHLWGALLHELNLGAGGTPVLAAMHDYHFRAGGWDRTMWMFYTGFSLTTFILLALISVLLWQLAGAVNRGDGRDLRPFMLTLALALAAITVACIKFLIAPPAVGCGIAALLTLAGAFAAGSKPVRGSERRVASGNAREPGPASR